MALTDEAALDQKYERLREILTEMGSVAVAFSSGVDSTFLLWVAHDVLGDKAVAYTATSIIYPSYETNDAAEFCREYGIPHVMPEVHPLDIEGFRDNPPNKCYICKKEIFGSLLVAAKEAGLAYVVDGTNLDDVGTYRPGMKALEELDVRSPLKEAGLTKQDIRDLSQRFDLPTWDKPSYACLVTRFEYGERITEERLAMVGSAEQFLLDEGFRQVRVRYHAGDIARIEMDTKEFEHMFSDGRAALVDEKLRELGFAFVTLDLGGYATGKINAKIEQAELEKASN